MKKILIADDNRTLLMYLGLLLKRFEFGVLPAESGVEVLRLLKLVPIDLVVLDVHMQQMDGITLLRYIKEDKRTADIPVIMLSTDSSSDTMEQCRSLGCFDYLTKPVKIDTFHDTLQRGFFSGRGTNRKFLRVPYPEKVRVSSNGTSYELYAESLSTGGIFIRKEDPLHPGTEVNVKCDLKNFGVVQLKGRVIYTKQLFGDFLKLPPGMAVSFQEMSEGDSRSLNCFVEDRLARDIFDSQQEVFIERTEEPN
ncbi:MAG: response regulator [Nitrospirae bacterium]|nr:MAG: response regulator [Nitrospirota bacterium]